MSAATVAVPQNRAAQVEVTSANGASGEHLVAPRRLRIRVHLVVAVVAVSGVLMTFPTVRAAGAGTAPPWVWVAVLAIGAAVGQLFPIFVAHGDEGEEVNVEEVVWVSVFLILPPIGVLIVMLVSAVVAQVVRRREALKAVFNVGAQLVSAAVGLAVIDVIGGTAGSPMSGRQVAASGAAVLAWSLTMTVCVWVAIATATGERLRSIAKDGAGFSMMALPLSIAWGLIAAVAIATEPWLVIPAAAPVVLLWDLQRASKDRRVLRRLLEAAQRMAVADTESRVMEAVGSLTTELVGATSAVIVVGGPVCDLSCSRIPLSSQLDQWLVVRRHTQAGPWTRADQEVLDAVASMAGTALDNARLLQDVRDQAERDPLTRIPNRVVLERVLEEAAATGRAGLLVVDVDRFKRINDNLGHRVGDAVAIVVAARITDFVDSLGTVCRLGGDEFAVVTDQLDPDALAELATSLLELMREPVRAAGHELHLAACIGAAHQAAGATSAAGLLRRASAAANRAKEPGSNHYEDATGSSDDDEFLLEHDLRYAVMAGGLNVVYQPVLAMAGQVESAEALVRWNHPVLGVIPPDRFLPLAERLGLVSVIDMWMLEQAVLQLKAWTEDGIAVRVAVNMSVSTLARTGIVERVIDVLRHHGVAPTLLEVEITEQISTHQPEVMIERLRHLRLFGVTIAIDDFGTGFSSLSRLQTFPVDRIKIDRSFLTATTHADDPMPIVSASIDIAHRLGLQVTAEGVERQDQHDYLCGQGCDSMQGFLFSPGVSADAFTELYRERNECDRKPRAPGFAPEVLAVPPG